jgi:hypothetical protein
VTRLDHLDRLIEKSVAIKDETAQQKQQREALLGERRKAQEELNAFVSVQLLLEVAARLGAIVQGLAGTNLVPHAAHSLGAVTYS